MTDINYSYSKKIFSNILETSRILPQERGIQTEGIVKSINEFISLLVDANSIYNETYKIPENKQLIIAEEMPNDLLSSLNGIENQNINDIRVVTYIANEEPATISARKINEDGIKNIKWRFAGVFDDPDYTGYSIIRYIKEVEAYITFKVWGKYFEDIRQKAKMLKEVIELNSWYFKHKGLRDIVWLGSFEEEIWDAKNIAKFKTQKYMIRYAEVKELRQKNIEQVVINYGLN